MKAAATTCHLWSYDCSSVHVSWHFLTPNPIPRPPPLEPFFSLAQLVTAVTFNVAADLVAQSISKSKKTDVRGWTTWDFLPPLRLALWGVLCTPIVDEWCVAKRDGSRARLPTAPCTCNLCPACPHVHVLNATPPSRLGFLDATFGAGTDLLTLGKKLCVDQVLPS